MEKVDVKDKIHIRRNTFSYATKEFFRYIMSFANYWALILLCVSIGFYLTSLRGCSDGQAICLKNLNEGEVRDLASYILYSSALISLVFVASIYGYVSYIITILMAIIYGYICLYYDTGADLEHHGSYNRALLFIEIILFTLLINLIILIFYFLIKYTKIAVIILTFMIVSGYYIYDYKISVSCDKWLYGLKHVKLDNNHDTCKITPPKECYIDVMSGWFDYSGWFNEECKVIRGGEKAMLMKYMPNKNATRLAFPPTQIFKHYPESKYLVLNKNVMKNLFDMDDPELEDEIKEHLEVIVDFTDEKESKIVMNMKKDDETVSERKPLYEESLKNETTRPLAKNFLYVYIDSLSRTHFYRKLPKLVKYLEKYYQNEESKWRTYQFPRFQNLGYFTNINMIPVWFGKWWLSKGGKYYITSFKEKGFMTGQSINNCGRGVFDFDTNDHKKLKWDEYDHENVGMFCDPNYFGEDNPYTPFLGAYSVKRRCLHGKDTSQHVIDYTKLFWRTYKDEPKAFRMGFLDAHEGTGEIVKYLDDKLVDFFNELESENLLDDTIVLFMADHGMNMPGVVSMLNGEDHQKEKFNPFLFMMVPDKAAKVYDFNLSDNEQEMITMWDIRNTILHIAGDIPRTKYEKLGTSLFNKISASSTRNCEDMMTKAEYCVCHN